MILAERVHSLFHSSMQTYVCPVNKVGVMGAGLALAFAKNCPGLLDAYKAACDTRFFRESGLFLYHPPGSGPKVLCLATKDDWRNPSTYDLIRTGLQSIVDHHQEMGIHSLALPKIGCGRGGLDWDSPDKPVDVRRLIYEYLHPIDFMKLEVEIYL